MKNLYPPVFLILLFISKLTVTAQVPLLNSYPSASAVVFLDFDGHTVIGTSWNTSGPIYCGPSGLDNAQITEVFNRVAEDYRPFNLNITTDSTKFLAAPLTKRMRVIITVSSSWYGSVGGVSYIGSFSWGDDTPCFIFSALLGYSAKNVSEATSHESGHTLGLYHQSSYDANCNKISDYNYGQGTGETGWAPIMGSAYSKNYSIWHNGPGPYGCAQIQNDLGVIANTIGANAIRNDDYSNDFSTATQLIFNNNQFLMNGFIETNSDSDLVKFTVPSLQHFILNATPYNIGNNNLGSDLDIQVSLFNSSSQLINSYNPGAFLNAVIDSTLGAGIYFLRVHGSSNANVSYYGSLGSYSLQASLSSVILPLHKLELKGKHVYSKHELNWIIEADEELLEQQMQISSDGVNFTELINIPKLNRTFLHTPTFTSTAFYRLKILLGSGEKYFSNIVVLSSVAPVLWPHLITNTIYNDCSVNSPGDFTFSVYSASGQFISKGNLDKGFKLIPATHFAKGIYIINFSSRQGYYSEKFIKQ